MEDDYNQLLASHDQDIARILENQQAQQNKQKIALEVEFNIQIYKMSLLNK